jgi:hypothetical protein
MLMAPLQSIGVGSRNIVVANIFPHTAKFLKRQGKHKWAEYVEEAPAVGPITKVLDRGGREVLTMLCHTFHCRDGLLVL